MKTRLFRHWQSDGAVALADHVVCLSSHDRDYLIGHLGQRPDRVTRLVNGTTTDPFPDRNGAPQGQRVLFVGGWLDVKGRQVLPRLWPHVRACFPAARLTVVGAGLPTGAVISEFEPVDRDFVQVIPVVTREGDMRDIFSSHDLFLMPSLSEGSPLALLEAMAAGLPVVASRVGGIPDIVTDGVDGLLFDPLAPSDGAGAVCRLLGNAEEANRLGHAAQDRVRALTWESAAEALLSVIQKVTEIREQEPTRSE